MTGLVLFAVAAYLAAVILAYFMHPTLSFAVAFAPKTSYGLKADIKAHFTVKGDGIGHIFSILVPFGGIEEETNTAIRDEVTEFASKVIYRWALRPDRNRNDLEKELGGLSSPNFTMIRALLGDVEIPPEPKELPRPKSHAERMLDDFDDRLFATSLFVNRIAVSKKTHPELWEDPIGLPILKSIFHDMKGQILLGEPKKSYRSIVTGARGERAE